MSLISTDCKRGFSRIDKVNLCYRVVIKIATGYFIKVIFLNLLLSSFEIRKK